MWLRFVPAGLWALLIFYLSSRPQLPETPMSFPGLDKVAHAVVYGILTALLLFADRWPVGRRGMVWVVAAFVYGISDEIHQSIVPSRSPDVFDLVADLAGALLVFGAVRFRALSVRPMPAGSGRAPSGNPPSLRGSRE